MRETYSLRIPEEWGGHVNSPRVREWLAGYFRQPSSLPSDPGPGDLKVNLSLPRRAVRTLSAMHEVSQSSALRRLIALGLGLPAAPSLLSLPGGVLLPSPPVSVETVSQPSLRPRKPLLALPEPNSGRLGLSLLQEQAALRQRSISQAVTRPRRSAVSEGPWNNPVRVVRSAGALVRQEPLPVWEVVALSMAPAVFALLLSILGGSAPAGAVAAGQTFAPWTPAG